MGLFQKCCAAMMVLFAGVVPCVYADDACLEGKVISKEGRANAAYAFDGDVSTYYEAHSADGQWVGLDLGRQYVITHISFTPRQNGSTGSDRMLLSLFEGANRSDFMDAVPLYLISEAPEQNKTCDIDVRVSRGFRYVRYVGSAGSYCNVAELKFYGYEGAGDDTRFYQVTCLPTVSIHVTDESVPEQKGQDFDSRITITYENGTLIQEYPVLTRVRGNFSATHENKPYRIKFNDGKSHHMLHGSARDESPAKAKKWTLINNYGDKTLFRNNVAYEVSRRVGMPFTPWCRCVDLILNGDYRGCYQLTDYIGLDKNRINIAEMDDTCTDSVSITGGYLLEMNGYAGQDPVNFTSRHGNPVSVNDPDEKDIVPVQYNYIRDYFNKMEDRVFCSEYTDTLRGYRRMLDLDTFLRYFLACEFNGNTDMLWQVFMYKQRSDSLIYTGPVWDNDLALDNDFNVYPGNQREEWTYKVRTAGNWGTLVSRILSDGNATAHLQALWAQLRRDSLITADEMGLYVDSLRTLLQESQRLNFLRWPYLTQQLHCNPRVWGTWEAEVNVVKNYVEGRVAWMDQKLNYGSLRQENNVYQISSPLDLCQFSEIVRDGNNSAHAELLCNIDMSEFSHLFIPIGTSMKPYKGTFSGNGYTIDGLRLNGDSEVALFAYVADGCVLSDVFLGAHSRVSGQSRVAALVGVVEEGSFTMNRCGNLSQVMATDAYAAALVAEVRRGATALLDNCYNVGSVSAHKGASAMVAWSEGTVGLKNCYNAAKISGAVSVGEFAMTEGNFQADNCYDTYAYQVKHVKEDDVRSGRLCWMLVNGDIDSPWRQNINNVGERDEHPVPVLSHSVVYKDNEDYTNINPSPSEYRYFMLDVSAVQGGSLIQFSEFDLLDVNLDEYPLTKIYSGTESSISNENWQNLTDNNLSTKYCSQFSGRSYFMFDAGGKVNLYGYRICTANDTSKNPSRNPACWRLYGTNAYTENPDAASWTLIDEQTGEHPLPVADKMACDYTLLRPVTSLEMKSAELTLPAGSSATLQVTVSPRSMQGIPLQWKSDNENVARVDADGRVSAVAVGKCTITVEAPEYGTFSAQCEVTVTEAASGYRYFLLALDGVQRGSAIQFSEFDLLDEAQSEYANLSMYGSSAEHYSDEVPENVVDNNVSTKWCGPLSETAYLYLDAGDFVRPSGYRFYTAADSKTYAERNPASWRLYGSRVSLSSPDADGWILLDKRTDDATLEAVNLTPFDFLIDYNQVADAIEGVKAEDCPVREAYGVYDLGGRRWESLSKARKSGQIYILNGLKRMK